MRSTRLQSTRSARRPISRHALFVLTCLLLPLAFAPSARAQLRDYTVRWQPSPSSGVEGYELSVQTTDAAVSSDFDLGLPSTSGGVMSRTIQLEGSVDLVLRLRAYGGGRYSPYSNEIAVAKAASAPQPTLAISSIEGVTGVLSGSLVIEAETTGPVESVSFSIDGTPYRIENAVPWSLPGYKGGPGAENPFDTTFLSNGRHTLEAIGWSEDGATGDASLPFVITFFVDNGGEPSPAPGEPLPAPDPTPGLPPSTDTGPPTGPDDSVVGLYVSGDHLVALRTDGTYTVLVGYHLIGSYDIRPAWCDLDADGDRDLVVGFGPGSLSLLLLLTMQDLEVVDVQVIPGANDRYAYAWGETFPACGDVDGDGLAELAIGLGEGSTASISMLDDHESGYAPMTTAFRSLVRTLPTTATLGLQYWETGAAKPVLADVDGDGRDEIVVGRSAGGRGTISVFDDAETGFVVMLPLSPSEGVIDAVTDADYRYLDGATEVAAGDVDGDGRAEIVVATRRAGETGIDVIDDALTGFAPLLESAVQIAPDGGAGAPLELLDPGLGDIDGDGRLEVSLGMGATEGGLGRVQVLDDLETGFAPLVWTADEEGIVEAPAEAGIVWPAIEANPQP